MRGCDNEIIDFCLTANCENGDATPDLENLVKLTEILEVSLDQLILGKEPQVKIERVVETRETDRQMKSLADARLFPLFSAIIRVIEKR